MDHDVDAVVCLGVNGAQAELHRNQVRGNLELVQQELDGRLAHMFFGRGGHILLADGVEQAMRFEVVHFVHFEV